MNPQLIICGCQDEAHQIIIRFYEDEGFKTVCLQPHLVTNKPFFNRLKQAWRFLLKKDCDTWDSIILDDTNYHSLKQVVAYLEGDNEILIKENC